jgi:SAM-dependent methyltransferase
MRDDDVPELVHDDEPAAPASEQDAGDSGEIISDDLLEEVDDTAEPAPPPVPDTEDAAAVDGEAIGEAPAPSEAPAPPPAPAKKPPPAPRGQAVRAAAVAVASGGKGRRRRGKPWFEEIFEEDYLRTLPFLTPQATQSEARFVADSLVVDPGAQLLDVGCGYGRHAMELAARGYHVVARDASLPLLLRGADEAQRRGLDINFVHGDMRELTFDSQFDGAYCLFSTFGYFDDETNKKTAQNIARALKPGARFVVEVLNRDYLIADLPSRVWWEGDGCVVLEEVEFNYFSSRIVSNRSVVFDDGRQLEQEISIRAYSLHEFGKLLHAAGFRVVEISGSMVTRGRFFGGHSRDIIVVAERRSSAPGSGDGK